MALEGVLIKFWSGDLILIQFSCCSLDFVYSRWDPLSPTGWCRQLNARTSDCMAPKVRICVAPKNSLSHLHVSPMMLHKYSFGTSLTPMSTSVSSSWTTPGAPPKSQERRAYIPAGRSHEMWRQIHLTRDIFSTRSSLCTHHILAQGVGARVS